MVFRLNTGLPSPPPAAAAEYSAAPPKLIFLVKGSRRLVRYGPTLCCCRCRRCCRRRLVLTRAVGRHPATMNSRCQTVGGLRVDWTLLHHASECEPQMVLRATEPVVEPDVTIRRVDIVTPQQARDAPPGPDAFRRTRRTGQLGLRLFIFGDGLGLGFMLRSGRVGGLLPLFGRLLFALGLLRRLRLTSVFGGQGQLT